VVVEGGAEMMSMQRTTSSSSSVTPDILSFLREAATGADTVEPPRSAESSESADSESSAFEISNEAFRYRNPERSGLAAEILAAEKWMRNGNDGTESGSAKHGDNTSGDSADDNTMSGGLTKHSASHSASHHPKHHPEHNRRSLPAQDSASESGRKGASILPYTLSFPSTSAEHVHVSGGRASWPWSFFGALFALFWVNVLIDKILIHGQFADWLYRRRRGRD
jgi:hypothetical protein